MNLAEPLLMISPGARGRVLAVLTRTRKPLTGRGVARLVGNSVSRRAVADVLNDLVATGIVSRQDHPPAALYSLNRDHLAAAPIEQLTGMRGALFERLGAAVASWQPSPVSVTVFGSAARGDGGIDSDIDVLVVRPDDVEPTAESWEQQSSDLARDIERWTGNPGRLIEFSLTELRNSSEEPIVQSVRAEGVTVSGDPIRRLVPRARAS